QSLADLVRHVIEQPGTVDEVLLFEPGHASVPGSILQQVVDRPLYITDNRMPSRVPCRGFYLLPGVRQRLGIKIDQRELAVKRQLIATDKTDDLVHRSAADVQHAQGPTQRDQIIAPALPRQRIDQI